MFKKFEKENLFQLTCADVVERFQLWLMLTIIALRNIVETGAFDIFVSLGSSFGSSTLSPNTNSTPLSTPPRTATSILPKSFTLFPSSLISSLSGANSPLSTLGQILGPFLIVLGSEMMVDWLKHAYINKFNNTRPAIYRRFLDILAKDYYTSAFVDQNLNRRLGLPVIPLSCLFFRVCVQTYQMFLAALVPFPPSSTAVETSSLSSIHSPYFSPSPSSAAGSFMSTTTLKGVVPVSAAHINVFFRAILANAVPTPARSVQIFTVALILTGFIALLVLKLILGMLLLSFARSRYKSMKNQEIDRQQQQQQQQRRQSQGSTSASASATVPSNAPNNATNESWGSVLADGMGTSNSRYRGYAVDGSRRVGGWGVVEVNDDKRRWIYADDPEALRRLKEKEEKEREKSLKESFGGDDGIGAMDHVARYEMVAKRIW